MFDGVNDGLQSAANIDLSGTNKLTVAFWLWWDTFANDDHLALEFTATSATPTGFAINPNSGFSNNFRLSMAGNVATNAATYTRPSAAVWHHYVVIVDKSQAANEFDMYLDGVLQTPLARQTGNNTNNFSSDKLNLMCRNNASLFAAGRMAELALYPAEVLNANEAMALARGVRPFRIRPDSNPCYWPLFGLASPEPCHRSGAPAMTVNGAVYTNHAPVRPLTRLERASYPTELIPTQTLSATTASAALAAVAATLTPGAATMSAIAAQSALQAVTAALSAGAVTVLLTPAEAQALAVIGVLSAGAVTLSATAASAVLAAVTATLERGGAIVQYRARIEDVNEYGLRIES